MCFKNAAKATKSAGAVKDMHKKTPQAIEKYIANGRDASKLVRSWRQLRLRSFVPFSKAPTRPKKWKCSNRLLASGSGTQAAVQILPRTQRSRSGLVVP